MLILDEKGLSGLTKLILDLVLGGGIGLALTVPYWLMWYLNGSSRDFDFLILIKDPVYAFLLGFLYITGILALMIVQELRKIFKTINRRSPFMLDNVFSLRHTGVYSLIIALAYLVKIIFLPTILTFVASMIFIIAGLFALVLSEVFRQAVIVKAENDLTI